MNLAWFTVQIIWKNNVRLYSCLVCMMLHGNVTFSSIHIPNFDLFVGTSTGKDVPVFISILISYRSNPSMLADRTELDRKRFPRPEMLVPSQTKDRISVTAFFVFNWHLTKEVAGLVRKNKKKKILSQAISHYAWVLKWWYCSRWNGNIKEQRKSKQPHNSYPWYCSHQS